MKKNTLLTLRLIAIATVLLATSLNNLLAQANTGYKVGDTATDFKLKNVDGQMISMANYKDAKGFIVIFTCNTCPFSKMYEERINELNQKYASKGYPVLAINPNDVTKQPDDSFDAMIARAKDKNFSFPYLYDESQAIATAYGATRTPHVYIVSKKAQKLIVSYIGAIDNNHKDADAASQKYVEEAVNSLLAGKAVKTNFTKAIGCTIKWKEA
ncbi:thioredoxin family protein [Reichenbachiella carrageenanivorans]|uniref:Thioredoxin family protein n=1 Tax=Reichenbachiella carrageenanivorans TaxID=2979869 RepID=A0ABY6D0R6_9BACT|nr:thioredoxin family protein [Reichenbachiella carrageenanivorans]UXX79769.1 thioredoxin family protein [Reichenbachiella carrageenanivorans]